MITFDLPWPDARLMPNRANGQHWSATSKLRKDSHIAALLIAKRAVNGAVAESGNECFVPLSIVFVQPDKRRRDVDGLLSSIKPMIDGVAEALNIDDHFFNPITISREFGGAPGHVRVTIFNDKFQSAPGISAGRYVTRGAWAAAIDEMHRRIADSKDAA